MKRVELVFEGFEDTPVEVTVSPVPMLAYFDFLESWSRESRPISEFNAEIETFKRLAQPECNGKDFGELDLGLTRAVITAWCERVREAPLPLPLRRSGPPPSPEPSTAQPGGRSRRRRS